MQQPCSGLRWDMHTHTTFSDGKLSPQELVQRAVNRQIDVLAITDHDTTAAVQPAQQFIEQQQLPLILVPGVEISTRWHGFEIHIVGLNLDPACPALCEFLEQQTQFRLLRARKMGEKLSRAGWPGIDVQALAKAGEGQITRAHFAQALLDAGAVSHFQEAFNKYLGKGKRAYVTPQWPEIQQAVKVIQAAGGLAVLAHPDRYDLSTKWMRRLITEFTQAGGQALEVASPQQKNDLRRVLLHCCQEHGLRASVGSDFHGPARWTDLGMNLQLPDRPEVGTVLDIVISR